MASAGSATPAPRHARARQRGHRGGAIPQHRSIWSLKLPLHRLGLGVVIALAFTAVLALLQAPLAAFWSWQVLGWLQAMGLPGQFAPAVLDDIGLFTLPVPQVDMALSAVSLFSLAGHGLACVVVWVGAGWLPDAGKPGTYVLRAAVLIHAVSVLYFGFWPGSFSHSVTGHVGAGLQQSWMLLLLAPWLHLCTYYVFPFPIWQRLALTAVTLAYLALLAPLQYATHAVLLAFAGPVLMPLLHLLFGVMVPILGLVALYGWGMSWHDPHRKPGARRAR